MTLVGPGYPDSEDVLLADVSKEEFMRLIRERGIKQYLSFSRPAGGRMGDTVDLVDLYIDIGKGVKLRLQLGIDIYNDELTILGDLSEMQFKKDPKESKPDHYVGHWDVYKKEEQTS